jgi:predicted transcriptional regulator
LSGYYPGDTITDMKVAISLPDSVFQAAEHLARRLKKSRSRLYAEAIAEYVGAHGSSAITERLNAVYGVELSAVDEALQSVQFKILNHEAW